MRLCKKANNKKCCISTFAADRRKVIDLIFILNCTVIVQIFNRTCRVKFSANNPFDFKGALFTCTFLCISLQSYSHDFVHP